VSSHQLSPRSAAWIVAGAFAAGLLIEAAVLFSRSNDPGFVFLTRHEGAEWIRHDRPMEMALLPLGTDTTGFRTSFHLNARPESALLRFRALSRAEVWLDQTQIYSDPAGLSRWKAWREIDLTPALSPGNHVLTIVARHDNGPPFIQAIGDGLNLRTGPGWEGSRDAQTWSPAASADRIAPVPGSRAFPRADRALWSVAPWLASVFVLAALARWAQQRGRLPVVPLLRSLDVRFVAHAALLIAFGGLGLNAVLRVPVWFGFDVREHMEYIDYIVTNGRLPLAPDGWKMNEAPLFYLVAAIPYRFIYAHLTPEGIILAMRVIPLLCGLAQVEIALRTLRLVFPGQTYAQFAGAAICGLVPMNIYLSLFPSNQPFVGVWSALAVYFTLRQVLDTQTRPGWTGPMLIGLCLGLAILSKITGLLAVPGALLGLGLGAWRRPDGRARAFTEPLVVLAILSVISGWYFLRNQIELGTPFSVGFDTSLGTVWRQDPGFRAPGQLLRFGEGFWYPISAGFVGFWDSIYSTFWSDGFISSGQVPMGYVYDAAVTARPSSVPPWDFRFLGAAALLSLGPVALMSLGGLRAITRPGVAIDRGTLLCIFWIGTHLAGMLFLYLSLPTVSAGKAAYALNVLPCFGVLAAQGIILIERRPILGAVVAGAVAAWGVAVYAAFFVK